MTNEVLAQITIVGRPNVGKSTLFNRLLGKRKALVFDEPGVTRDLNIERVEGLSIPFTLIDTGGFDPETLDPLLSLMKDKAKEAIEGADLLLFVIDTQAGILPTDHEIARFLKTQEKNIIVVANKVDEYDKHLERSFEAYELGFEKVIPLSSEHNRGVEDLLEEVEKILSAKRALKEENPEEPSVEEIPPGGKEILGRIAIIGKPNAGKSSLFNELLGFERVLTCDMPGTTVDSVEAALNWNGKEIRLIDTAGIRRKARVEKAIEKFSIIQAVKAIEGADLVLLTVDATKGVTDQEKQLGSLIEDRGKSCLVLVNKWDLVEGKNLQETKKLYTKWLKEALIFLPHAEVHFISVKEKKGIKQILKLSEEILEERKKKISTSDVNAVLKKAIEMSPPKPSRKIKAQALRIFYGSQVKRNPPTFMMFSNDPENIEPHYRRYLSKVFHEAFGFKGTPLRFVLKRRDSHDRA